MRFLKLFGRVFLSLAIVVVLSTGSAFAANVPIKDKVPKLKPVPIDTNLTKPRSIAIENGIIYVMDGLKLKKYKDGKIIETVDFLKSGPYLEKYGLGELEDLYTLRHGSLAVKDGVAYLGGVMLDRFKEPKYNGEYKIYTLGITYIVIFKITDHFEPIHIDRGDYFTLGHYEYEGLMKGDPRYVDDPVNSDYIYRIRGIIPNLIKAHDGRIITVMDNMWISPYWHMIWDEDRNKAAYEDGMAYFYMGGDLIKQTDAVIDYDSSTRTIEDIKNGKGRTSLNGKGDVKYFLKDPDKPFLKGHTPGLFEVLTEPRPLHYAVKPLDEAFIPLSELDKTKFHLSYFVTIHNKYVKAMNGPSPENRVYAIPSIWDPGWYIVFNGEFTYLYNPAESKYKTWEFVPGNSLPSMAGVNRGLYTIDFSPTRPCIVKDGIMFISRTGTVWRLYADKYAQDFGSIIPFGWSVIDWTADDENRTFYALMKNTVGEKPKYMLASMDYSYLIPKAVNLEQKASPGVDHFTVIKDNSTKLVGVNGSKGVFKKNGSLYVPIDPVLYMVNISIHEDKIINNPDGTISVMISNDAAGESTYITAISSREGTVLQKHMPVDELFDTIYRLTGQRYTYNYDEATNTLYINTKPGTLQLFDGWWSR